MPAYSAHRLNVTLQGAHILHDVSFSLEEGTWTGLIGPNGSGKTTLLRAMGGLLDFEGRIDLDGRSIRDWTPRELARRVAFVRQSHPLTFDFRVDELVLLGRSPHKSLLSSYDRTDFRRVEEALALVDLSGLAERSFQSLSGGEQQRVFLAQALVQEATVLLLDEPTTYLDVHHQFEFMQHVRAMVDGGMTVIGAFHDLELAARFSDGLLVMSGGRAVASGAPTEILTPSLLEEVFRMQAFVEPLDGELRIVYGQPIRKEPHPSA